MVNNCGNSWKRSVGRLDNEKSVNFELMKNDDLMWLWCDYYDMMWLNNYDVIMIMIVMILFRDQREVGEVFASPRKYFQNWFDILINIFICT